MGHHLICLLICTQHYSGLEKWHVFCCAYHLQLLRYRNWPVEPTHGFRNIIDYHAMSMAQNDSTWPTSKNKPKNGFWLEIAGHPKNHQNGCILLDWSPTCPAMSLGNWLYHTLPHGSRPGSAGVRKAAGATGAAGAADVAVAGAARRSILSGFGKIQTGVGHFLLEVQ